MISPEDAVGREIEKAMEREYRALIKRLEYVGLSAVAHARSLPSPNKKDFPNGITPHQPNYIDWNANLRSSIGYVIIDNGHVLNSGGFEVVGNGTAGAAEGEAYAESLVSKFSSGIALVVVAGMSYASYVADKGYDVLDSAELVAEDIVKQLMEKMFG